MLAQIAAFWRLRFSLILPALTARVENLLLAAGNAADALNARGETMELRLQDIVLRAREVAHHGVRHGTSVGLAAAQVRSGHDVTSVEPWFPDHGCPEEHSALVDTFTGHGAAVADRTPPDLILSLLF